MGLAIAFAALIAARIWAELAYRNFVKTQPASMQARLAAATSSHF
jgi:hypothetical protein